LCASPSRIDGEEIMPPGPLGKFSFFQAFVPLSPSPFCMPQNLRHKALARANHKGENNAAPICGVAIPLGYRDWQLISLSHVAAGKSDDPALVEARMALKQLPAQLGNDIAIKALREGKLPFPDGAIIAALHWNEARSDENDKVLAIGFPDAGLQSSVPKSALNVQFMLKDSKGYAATGG